ncbi:hypothetical protein H261_18395 [Paramagnetospirillum caucaseum]|uniref:Uncharacterized protein n=1 Tax=Paramagnetospirillum caucaseum TaxID=1244869 RepID=M2Y5V7_9PROT|nr:hypothetical protein H261_18395 [Paramagnetospirillum caucaseum]
MLLAALVLAAVQPAWAYPETQPGEKGWPEIPGRIGMKGFEGTWKPRCDDGAYIENGAMTVHGDGRISYQLRKPYLPIRYRVIETTPHYVVTLVQTAEPAIRFWVFRPLDHWHTRTAISEMTDIGINECPIYGDAERKRAIWNFGDAELAEFWRTNKFCHPSLTPKIEGGSYWGGDWGQACWFDQRER